MEHLEKGLFLIASPEIDHPFYRRSVLLLCDHSAAGSFGLAVNKPFETSSLDNLLTEVDIPFIEQLSTRSGGLMQQTQMMLLHTSEDAKDQTLQVSPGIFLGGDLDFLEKQIAEEKQEMLLCFGYSGWNPGQLEKEFGEGSWYTFPASADYLFKTPPEKLWQTLLYDMGGKFRSLSLMPNDLSLN
jgi:putative transcriptional regulator